MNRQQMFDTIAEHLLRQGEQSINDIGTCLYRGPCGLKCAIGALIPDEIYEPAMEQFTLDRIAERARTLPDMAMAFDLRSLHDGSKFFHEGENGYTRINTPDWPAALIDYAECNDLDPAIVYRTLEEA